MENNENLNGETAGEPRKKNTDNWGLRTRFGSGQAQPSNEAKRAGWERVKKGKKLAQYLLGLQFVGEVANLDEDGKVRSKLKKYFGLTTAEAKDMSNEAAIMLRQIGSAIEGGDNNAAMAILERAYGKTPPVSNLEVEMEDENMKPQLHIEVVYNGVGPGDTPAVEENEIEATDQDGNKIEIQ